MTPDTPPIHAGRTPLQAHSLAEAHFYLMVRICDHCGEGPLLSAASVREPGRHEGRSLVTMQAKCSHCNEEAFFWFEVPDQEPPPGESGRPRRRINSTDEPSEILDVTQWVTLHRIVLNAAERVSDRGEARELRCDAAECLDEALRFYEEDSDLPPAEALFSERSRRRVKGRPELYIRQALIAKRRALPTRDVGLQSRSLGKGGAPGPGASADSTAQGKRRWWRWWR